MTNTIPKKILNFLKSEVPPSQKVIDEIFKHLTENARKYSSISLVVGNDENWKRVSSLFSYFPLY